MAGGVPPWAKLAGRATCDALRAAVRRAWRDVARLPCEDFRVAPPPTTAALEKLRRCHDG
ncbi:hypothetical protein F511_45073 [Dorcoceras hygrometricum]|uniref:Uncharacterized protein n=1 Tax=Dorcoceras hygrometricum TaxID=472368 RepID=A0A2Z6ZY71_9LAMI|nr:hypothetical protein F511_45073 [Dorcoceras hygrometricum]